MQEALLELTGSGPAAGIDFTAFLQPDLGETDHDPAEQAQGKGRDTTCVHTFPSGGQTSAVPRKTENNSWNSSVSSGSIE